MDSSTLSNSSTSCLKVGLWLGTACQHSRIFMYLSDKETRSFLTALHFDFHSRGERLCGCSQLVRAVGGFIHAVSFLQQLEELLHRDARVGRATQREGLPHQDAERPPERRSKPISQLWKRRKCSFFGEVFHSHVTLVCVDSVKQGLRSHPLDWQPSLQDTPSH